MLIVSDIVDVIIEVQSSALTRQGFNSLLIVGSDSDFGAGFLEYEVRSYTSYAQLAADTDILDGTLKEKAQVAFAQSPAVPRVYISRIDAGSAAAAVGELTFDATLVTGNSIAVTVNDDDVVSVPFNSDNATTLTDIATAIQASGYVATAVSDGTDTITVTGANDGGVLVISAVVTGGASQAEATFAYTTNPVGDITSSDLDAVNANEADWFGFVTVYEDDQSQLTAASWLAAAKKTGFFLRTNVTNIGMSTNLCSQWYTSSTYTGTQRHLDVAIASRILAYEPGTYTAAFKTLELVLSTSISGTIETKLRAAFINQYSPVAGRSITWDGKASAGGFIDLYIFVVYLEARIAEDNFAQLAAVKKLPFSDDGIAVIQNTTYARLNDSVDSGALLADPAPVVNAPLANEVNGTDKSNRLLPNVTFTAYASNAIQTIQINGTLVA